MILLSLLKVGKSLEEHILVFSEEFPKGWRSSVYPDSQLPEGWKSVTLLSLLKVGKSFEE